MNKAAKLVDSLIHEEDREMMRRGMAKTPEFNVGTEFEMGGKKWQVINFRRGQALVRQVLDGGPQGPTMALDLQRLHSWTDIGRINITSPAAG